MSSTDGSFYTKHLNREDEIVLGRRIVDICNRTMRSYEIQETDFLDPRGVEVAISIINRFDEVSYSIQGIFDNAERAIITIYPSYMCEDDIDSRIVLISAIGNFKFFKASHRDVLGSLLNLGIERDKIGDIIVSQEEIQFAVKKELEHFILSSFNRMGKLSIKCNEKNFDEKLDRIINTETLNLNISALRLDSLIAAIANINRKKACDLISAEKVKLNWRIATKNSADIKENDQIAIRGFGRFKLSSVNGQTKKDRFRITVLKYV